ncbi:MAG: 2,3,4,5-tetrahydropyridine-2,6-dicarboxylate N-succinyltransferase [Alphaproteobacteria bacterium]|nr:2,3,4,5-tetrahydropyridine-2,6-dicarboxylate N-succinyltransferase [Alphaproteobacteria bacterium]
MCGSPWCRPSKPVGRPSPSGARSTGRLSVKELQSGLRPRSAASWTRTPPGRSPRRPSSLLDKGQLRVAEPIDGDWVVHEWVKQAVLLWFRYSPMETHACPPFEFHDKVPLKKDLAGQGVRVVPPGAVRHGAYCERGVVVMPGYVNIGAWVGAGTMVDTWATVGSCAQIGRGVHLSGGVGIGGVLEPLSARPVIVEDGCFLGSRSIVVEGVHLEAEVVLGANTVLTASTPIIDVTGPDEVVHRGRVPARSVVIPGTRVKSFPAGDYHLSCALIIGRRKASTDKKTSLNDVLREFAVQV